VLGKFGEQVNQLGSHLPKITLAVRLAEREGQESNLITEMPSALSRQVWPSGAALRGAPLGRKFSEQGMAKGVQFRLEPELIVTSDNP
jgi:hypothetical protein